MDSVTDIRRGLDICKENILRVCHMQGSSRYEPKNGGSWKAYWENKKFPKTFPTKPELCACCAKLTNPCDFVGAHIQEAMNSNKQYIYPLCKTCNDTYGESKEESPIFDVKRDNCVEFLLSEAKVVHPDKSE